MPKLDVQQLSVAHIGPIDLVAEPARMVCISGVSGSGKSLLLRALADLLPHTGVVTLDGMPMEQFPPVDWRRQVGYLPAETPWWFDDVVSHFTQRNDVDRDKLGLLASVWEWPVSRLSSGEKQRLGLLRLLQNTPSCLLLDEPTASLDHDNTLRVESMVSDYMHAQQACVVWVSHQPQQIERLACRHYRIERGRLVPHD